MFQVIIDYFLYWNLKRNILGEFQSMITSVWLWSADGCLHPLGISDGRIKDNQFTAPSAFDNDFTTFGAHRARLNTTGYRSAPENAGESWLKVDLGHTVVVTAIATQGYGNPEVMEWVTAYILLYSQGSDYVNFKDTNGETQVRGSRYTFPQNWIVSYLQKGYDLKIQILLSDVWKTLETIHF